MKIQPYLEKAARGAASVFRAVSVGLRRATPVVLRAGRRAARATWYSAGLRATLRPIASLVRTGAVAAVVACLSVAALRATTQTVLPTEIGVIQRDWGGEAGIVPEDLGPSKRFVVPGVRTLHRLDRRIHFARFGMESEGNGFPSLELRTPDDLEVRVGASVPYRIIEGSGHRLVEEGIRSTYPDLARAAIERVLLDALGSLRREEWSSVAARERVRTTALIGIRAALAPFHLEPLDLQISSTWFPPEFEVEMMEQKLLEQRILTDAMLARRDERNYELLTEQEIVGSLEAARAAELDFEIEQERIGLRAEVREVESAASQYAFERKTAASNLYEKALTTGRLKLDEAEALREQLLNEALESEGGRVMVAREAASNLKFTTVKLDANNPNVPSVLDLDALIELLLGEGHQ
ncbi:hypothetical protein Poly30_05250 [Planctomycetes bacterium Poly30]|uniref:Band 7 domain-containing protein n=1 Tax=Saltatorellus ferox TaxID=2528018 RepID=A0A518ELR6_9BACT|nr:hypothetical protein Poly30_05250 [Planctomycetes bacterium Poly30]